MKAIVTAAILSASLNVFAEASPGAFDKLRKMFEVGSAPESVAVVYTELAKIKACAGSSKSSPNEISNIARLNKVIYNKPGFGPSFPPEVFTGILLNSTPSNYTEADSSFFVNYKEILTSSSLELTTIHYYTAQSCYKDDDGFRQCDNYTASANATAKIRINGNFLVYENGDTYAYCWK